MWSVFEREVKKQPHSTLASLGAKILEVMADLDREVVICFFKKFWSRIEAERGAHQTPTPAVEEARAAVAGGRPTAARPGRTTRITGATVLRTEDIMATMEAEMATMAVDPAQGSRPVTDTRGAAVAAAAAGQGASTAAAVSTAGRITAAAGTAEPRRVAEGIWVFFS
jgi:hypothetical protein